MSLSTKKEEENDKLNLGVKTMKHRLLYYLAKKGNKSGMRLKLIRLIQKLPAF